MLMDRLARHASDKRLLRIVRRFLEAGMMRDGACVERAKKRILQITRRNRGISLKRMIKELNSYLAGWVTYLRYAA